MIGQERLNRLEGKIDAINENVQGTTPANPQAPAPDPQMDPASNGTGSARPVFTQQTANDLDQINRGDAMSNVLFNKQQGVSMKGIDPPKRYAQNKVAKKPAYRLGQKISKGDTTSFELRPKGRNEEGFMEFDEVIIPNKEYKRRMGK